MNADVGMLRRREAHTEFVSQGLILVRRLEVGEVPAYKLPIIWTAPSPRSTNMMPNSNVAIIVLHPLLASHRLSESGAVFTSAIYEDFANSNLIRTTIGHIFDTPGLACLM